MRKRKTSYLEVSHCSLGHSKKRYGTMYCIRLEVHHLQMAGKHTPTGIGHGRRELTFTVRVCVVYDGLHVNMLV